MDEELRDILEDALHFLKGHEQISDADYNYALLGIKNLARNND